jgi:hypothetical protein
MAFRRGVYIVPTHRWYIERTVWSIAGAVLLVSTTLAALVNPYWILLTIATAWASIAVSLTGYCVVGNILLRLGFTPMLGQPNLYYMASTAGFETRVFAVESISIFVLSGRPQSVVFDVHGVRRRRDGVVRRDRILHHGQRPVLAWR